MTLTHAVEIAVMLGVWWALGAAIIWCFGA